MKLITQAYASKGGCSVQETVYQNCGYIKFFRQFYLQIQIYQKTDTLFFISIHVNWVEAQYA